MAAPIDGYIKFPDDTGNSGKKDRAQSRVVGGNTVYEKIIVKTRQAQVLGVYTASTAQLVITVGVTNGTTTGYIWAHVPTATTANKKVRLRRCFVSSQHATALATPTAPRIRMDRLTFTGSASGAAITAAKLNSSYPTPVFDIRTAVTGLTPTLFASLGNAAVCGAITAAGPWSPSIVEMFPFSSEEDEWNVFAPGEGFVIYQDTVGTTSDTRVVNITFLWDEIDVS